MDQTPYVPALRFQWLTRFYDPVLRATLKEERFKGLLIQQAALHPGMYVLDLGCGTGTLTILLAQACPEASVVGLDGDPEVLAQAQRKVEAAGVKVELREGMAYDPPFPAGSFDRIVSSLVFHHLTTEDKRRTLFRSLELLRPGGELHIADWGRPQNALMRLAFLPVQILDGFKTTADSVAGRLPQLMKEAGFVEVAEMHQEMTLLGTLALYRARRPDAGSTSPGA